MLFLLHEVNITHEIERVLASCHRHIYKACISGVPKAITSRANAIQYKYRPLATLTSTNRLQNYSVQLRVSFCFFVSYKATCSLYLHSIAISFTAKPPARNPLTMSKVTSCCVSVEFEEVLPEDRPSTSITASGRWCRSRESFWALCHLCATFQFPAVKRFRRKCRDVRMHPVLRVPNSASIFPAIINHSNSAVPVSISFANSLLTVGGN